MLCLCHSPTLFNGRIIAGAEVSGGTDRQSRMAVPAFKTQTSCFIPRSKPPHV